MKFQKIIVATIIAVTLLSPATTFAQGWVPFFLNTIDEDSEDNYDLKPAEHIDFYGDIGYALGMYATMYKTMDGGRTWFGATGEGIGGTWFSHSVTPTSGDYVFVSDEDSVFSINGKWMMKSDDGGDNIDPFYLSYVDVSSSRLSGVSQIGDGEFYFSDETKIYLTQDNFETASEVYNGEELEGDEYIFSMSTSDSGEVIIALVHGGYYGMVISQDAGETFEFVHPNIDLLGNAEIDFVSDEVIYLAIGRSLYKSIDSGSSWERLDAPDGSAWYGGEVSFVDEENGVAMAYVHGYGVGTYGSRIYFTSDGGYNWTLMNYFVSDEFEFSIKDLYYESPDRIFASGSCYDATDSELDGACILRYNTAKGVLVKSENLSNVYYAGSDGVLHWIPSEEIFYTWYDNFNDVETVPQSYIDSMEMGEDAVARLTGNQDDIETISNW